MLTTSCELRKRSEGHWWEPGRLPFLVRADGVVAGFALVHWWSALDKPLDHAVAEFFTLRKYRRAHVGTRAAQFLFDRLPGRWEVPVAAYNQGAILFWRAVAPWRSAQMTSSWQLPILNQ